MSDYQGDKFQKKLTELGISATEAAKRIEISRDTIHKWFKKEQLDHKQIVKITKGLGLSQDEIWGDDLSKPNAKPARFLGDGTPNMWILYYLNKILRKSIFHLLDKNVLLLRSMD